MLVRIAICLALLGGALPLWMAAPAHAATMEDVRKALADKRLFDAFQDLKELAEAGNAEAQYELGGFYHWGKVTAADFTKARAWYERAAKQGNVDAMLGLAVIYGHGQGVPQDKAASYRWLVLASSQHLSPEDAARIANARDDLAQDLTAQQIEAALAEARSFVPTPE
jgi:TPR repeat protein